MWVVLIVLAAGAVIAWKLTHNAPSQQSLILTSFDTFKAAGQQVRARDLLRHVNEISAELLSKRQGRYEFYPNRRIVFLHAPPDISFYCYCNLMEYMDLTRAIQNKILHNKDLPAGSIPEDDRETTGA